MPATGAWKALRGEPTMLRYRLTGTGFALPLLSVTLLFALLAHEMFAPQQALAADKAWNGGTSVWGTATNWSGVPSAAPGTSDNAVFNSTFSNQPTLGANTTVGGLWMTGSIGQNVTVGGTSTLTLSGNTINGTAGLGILVDNANTFALTVTAPITLGNAQTWTNNSTNLLTIGAVSLAKLILTVNGSGNTAISGVVSSQNASGGITKTGTGKLTLSGANTFSGQLTVQNGTLSIATINNANASGTLGNSGSGVILGDTGGSTGTLEYSGATASSNKAFTLATGGTGAFQIDSAAAVLTLSGVIDGPTGAFQKTGAGTLALTGANTFGGGSTLNAGTVVINSAASLGTGSATINAATLEVSAAFTSTRAFTLGNSASTLLIDSGIIFTGNGIFSGSGSLNKTGAGTLILGGVNSYAGATNITAGMVRDGSGTSIPNSSAVTVSTGATLDLNAFSETIGSLAGGGTVTTGAAGVLTLTAGGDNTSTLFSGVLQNGSGTVSLTKTGTGTLTLSGTNTYSGLTTISAGVINLQSATGLGTTGSGTTVASGAALQLQGGISVGNEALTLNGGGISNDGALRNISGTNTYAGVITLGSAANIFSDAGTLTLSNGLTNSGNTVTFGGAGNTTDSGVISGLGGVTKTGAGTLTLSGSNAYMGTTTINGGTLVATSDGNLGALTSAINVNAGTLEIATGFTTARMIALGNSASTFQIDGSQVFTVTTAITGSGTLNKTGSGTMILSAVNSFSGGTSVTGGTLQLGAIDRLLTTGTVSISGGTFDLQTFTQTAGAVTLASGSIIGTGTGALSGSSFTLQSGTVSGILAGGGTVTKNTSGTVTLSGSNSYTGSTTISAGTLQVNSNNALGTAASGTTVANGAVLKLNGVNYLTAEPLTLNGSGISNGGALTNSGTSTFSGPINAATNATINAGGGTLTLTGGLSKNGTTLTIAGGGTVNITTNGITGSSPNSDLVIDNTTVVLSAASSYNGPTTIQNSGTLQLGKSNVLPTSPFTPMTIATSSAFNLAGFSDTVGSLTGDSTAVVKNSGAGTSILTVSPGSGVSSTFAGVIAGTNGGTQGDVALQKSGAGSLILTGTNTFSGPTTVNGGTLTAANGSGSSLGSTSNVTVNSGGTFLLGASNQVNDTATVTLHGGTFSKGNFSEGDIGGLGAPGVGALTLTASGSTLDFGTGTVGVLNFASFTPGAFTLTIDNWTGSIATLGSASTDRLIFASNQSANLGSFNFTGFGPGAVEFDLTNGYWEVVPAAAVPETSTWVAAILGAAVVAYHFVRRRRAKA